MDFAERLASVFGGQSRHFSAASIFKFDALHPHVQKHLSRVYATLAAATLICAVGCAAQITYGLSVNMMQLVAFGCMMGMAFTPASPTNINKRYAMLAGFSFCEGAALGPLCNLAIILHPGVIFTAVLSTGAVFTCFTLAALLTPRRQYMFLGGYLSSAIMALMAMRVGGWMFGTGALTYSAELYGGLLIFAGYILFDTQLIVEKAYSGNLDHVRHALDLLVDLLALLVRIIIVLMRNAEKRQREEEEERRRKQRRKD